MDKLNNNDQQKLSDELIRARKELTILYEVSNAMRTTLDLNHILYIILTGVTSHSGLGFNRALLFLVNPNSQCLEPKMAIGPESLEDAQSIWQHISSSNQRLDDLIKEEKITNNSLKSKLFQSLKHLKIPLSSKDDNILANAYHQGTPMHILPEGITEFSKSALLQVFKTNELVIMPLKAKDKVIGLIVADNLFTQKPISDQDLKIFTMLANQAGLAIENSQLYEIVKFKSHSDSLTGLWNHGFFQNQLSKEIDNAREAKQPLSLLAIDIDNFKSLNDTYGHQYGDMVLKHIANVLKNCSREASFVCRYGGEEFTVILTQTDKEQGYIVAQRMREAVENYKFNDFTPNPDIKITVSIGLASFPEDSDNKQDLIAKADKAMYEAKFSGKNFVCVSEN